MPFYEADTCPAGQGPDLRPRAARARLDSRVHQRATGETRSGYSPGPIARVRSSSVSAPAAESVGGQRHETGSVSTRVASAGSPAVAAALGGITIVMPIGKSCGSDSTFRFSSRMSPARCASPRYRTASDSSVSPSWIVCLCAACATVLAGRPAAERDLSCRRRARLEQRAILIGQAAAWSAPPGRRQPGVRPSLRVARFRLGGPGRRRLRGRGADIVCPGICRETPSPNDSWLCGGVGHQVVSGGDGAAERQGSADAQRHHPHPEHQPLRMAHAFHRRLPLVSTHARRRSAPTCNCAPSRDRDRLAAAGHPRLSPGKRPPRRRRRQVVGVVAVAASQGGGLTQHDSTREHLHSARPCPVAASTARSGTR